MSKRIIRAFKKFDKGYSCAQSVLYGCIDITDLSENQADIITSGLGGGIARKQEFCGALIGGTIILGYHLNKEGLYKTDDKAFIYQKVNELIKHFDEQNKTHQCRELLSNIELNTKEGIIQFEKLDLKNKVCKKCISDTIIKIENMIIT